MPVSLGQFFAKQFIDVIQWNEPEDGVLAYRYPMQDMEIQNGGQLTVRESQVAVFVDQGKIADVFGPGLHTLNTRNLPILTDLKNWAKEFESPFKSDVYFFSTRLQIDQKWGTANPITIRDKEFGAVRLRAYGIYSWRIADPRLFFTAVSGTRETYYTSEVEGQLRGMIVAAMTDAFANSDVSFLDMASHQEKLADVIATRIAPGFATLGIELQQFLVENVSLPEELQEIMDRRIGVNMAGDLTRYTQFAGAQALQTAAANPGGTAGLGVGLGAGIAMAQSLGQTQGLSQIPIPSQGQVHPASAAPVSAAKFCSGCGRETAPGARFCANCGLAL
jgi:membrane protease subunit (stomatin/prohibitin family)